MAPSAREFGQLVGRRHVAVHADLHEDEVAGDAPQLFERVLLRQAAREVELVVVRLEVTGRHGYRLRTEELDPEVE